MGVTTDEGHIFSTMKTFDDVFSETREEDLSSTRYNDLCPMLTNTKERELWHKNMEQDCDDGEAFCWMQCLPLPEECPNEEDAMCQNNNNEPCFDDSMDPSCH